MLRRAIVHAGGGETEGKRVGKDPHPKAELWRWLRSSEAVAATVTEVQRQWQRRLGLRGRDAAVARYADLGHRRRFK
jgi:hypothetical protein